MSAIELGAISLELPAVVFLNGSLVVSSGIGIEASGMRFPNSQTMVCKELALNDQPAWILEASGCFREFFPRGKRLAWARPLSVLWRFTKSEFDAMEPRQITVGELLDRVSKVKKAAGHVPIAKDFALFLRKFERAEVVTREMLKAWPI